MSFGQELWTAVEQCEIHHPAYKRLADHLAKRVRDARAGREPRFEWVFGPTRVGKSALSHYLARSNSPYRDGNRRVVPVLAVKIPTGISPTSLRTSVLAALGVRHGKGDSVSDLDLKLTEQLKLAQTVVILFDEASHMVDAGAKVQDREAAEWFKVLFDAKLTVIMFGVPRLRALMKNEQLEGRANAGLEFRPYDAMVDAEYAAFASVVADFANLFEKYRFPFERALAESLVEECYLATGGRVGILCKFMQELCSALAEDDPRWVTAADCRAAIRAIGSGGHPDFPPFEGAACTELMLHSAHTYVLEANGLAPRTAKQRMA